MILYNTTGMSHLKADKLMIRVTKIKAMLFWKSGTTEKKST
jgi:hypothetical protein